MSFAPFAPKGMLETNFLAVQAKKGIDQVVRRHCQQNEHARNTVLCAQLLLYSAVLEK